MSNLDPRIIELLRATHAELSQQGKLPSRERLQSGYAAFRDRFGPERLSSLDGEALLQAMHTHGNKESLVYWLEFKNDDEFPGPVFGSIAGGSAYKFGLFRRKDSGQWVTGSPQDEIIITEAEAIGVARKHRDQLIAGVALLKALPSDASDQAYIELQRKMNEVAPDVSGLAWGHKYFSLLFPDKLDDYHNHDWQRYHLIQLLQQPPETKGLYVCAGRYVQLAREFEWPMNHFTTVLNMISGNPIHYWRIGTRLGEEEDIWPDMRDGGYVAIGWDWIGDLSDIPDDKDMKMVIYERLGADSYKDAKSRSRKAGEIRNFVCRIKSGDVVVAANGHTILGIGRVKGDYRFEPTQPTGAPHRREVVWHSIESWPLPQVEGLQTTVVELKKYEANLIEIERRLLGANSSAIRARPATTISRKLDGIPGKVQQVLDRKGQVILYGPPGTGKTFWARHAALELAALGAYQKRYSELTPEEQAVVVGSDTQSGLVRVCTFHPAYGYEDFIEGYRPLTNNDGQLSFIERAGIFKKLCIDAEKESSRIFFLLIDEINRGDIPRIFGELLTLLEIDKRGMTLSLPVSGQRFTVPANVRVIGTMNTADHSIALLDAALRRRFGFVELLPDTKVFGHAMVGDEIPLGPWLDALNERIRTNLGRDGRNLQIGHAYFLHDGKPISDFAKFVRVLAEDIIPLLQEYCYEDYSMLVKLLDEGLVDNGAQRVREELFEPESKDALVQALLRSAPEIVTLSEAKPAKTAPDEIEEQSEGS